MSTDEGRSETRVSDRGMVTIPAAVRHRLDIEPGDRLRWEVSDGGGLRVEVVRQRFGAFDGAETAEFGGDAVETHDLSGAEGEYGAVGEGN